MRCLVICGGGDAANLNVAHIYLITHEVSRKTISSSRAVYQQQLVLLLNSLIPFYLCVCENLAEKSCSAAIQACALKNSILRNATQLFVDAMASKPSKHHRLNQQTDRRLEEVLLDTRISPSKHSPQHTMASILKCNAKNWSIFDWPNSFETRKKPHKIFLGLVIYFFVVFFVIMYILTKARKLSMIVKMYELQNMCFSFSWQ